MQSLSYSEFSRRVHREVYAGRIPVNGTIELTNRCPLVCSHCYNNLPMNDLDARRRELNTDEHRRVADEIAEMGCLWLLYTGGEILARRDFFDIYEHAKRAGLLITLFTNGILIDERVADRLAALPPFVIEITLYGRTRETYERLTRIPGSFDKCMRGIELLLARNMPLKLKTVGISVNRHEIFAMKEFSESLGVEFKFDTQINPRIDCSAAPLNVRLAPEELVELDLRDSARIAEWKRLADEFHPMTQDRVATKTLYDCGGGVNAFAIDPYGDLTICTLSHFDKFNLRTGSFAEGWSWLTNDVRRRQVTRPSKCHTCGLKVVCGMCPANGELENGDPEAPVDFLCRTAHLRAAAFDIDLPSHGDCEYCNGGEHEAMIRDTAARLVAAAPAAPLAALTDAAACGSGGCSSCQVS
jgi:radical SAM protein with 4Fe4S-binding SPASM domain